jgi:hypothetical protein
MRVTTGYNPYAYRQQTNRTKSSSFADVYANSAKIKDQAASSADEIKPGGRNRNVQPIQPEIYIPTPAAANTAPKNPASVYDIPHSELAAKSAAASKECLDIDTDGLSKAEIYNRIEEVYARHLGKDFLEPHIVYGTIGSSELTPEKGAYNGIYHDFDGSLYSKGVDWELEPQVLREAKGYGGMSDNEIREAVLKKYPQNTTLKDCILIDRELTDLGFKPEGSALFAVDRVFTTLGMEWCPQAKKLYDSMLGLPADRQLMKAAQDAFIKDGYYTHPTENMEGVFKRILSWFGGDKLCSPELKDTMWLYMDKMMEKGELSFDKYGHCVYKGKESAAPQTQSDKPLAANYPATLSQEQISAIKSKYEVANLKWPSRESEALGEELFALGAINDEQRQFFYGAVKYTEDPFPLGILTPAGETPTRQLGYYPQEDDSMIDFLLGEMAVQQKNLDFMKSPDSPEKRNYLAEDGIPMEDHIKYLEDYITPALKCRKPLYDGRRLSRK